MNTGMIPYFLAMLVIGIGLYAIIAKKNIIKIIVGLIILDYGANLFLILCGYRHEGIAPIRTPDMAADSFVATSVDPVPQALILTSIVIGLGLVALMAAIAIRIYEKYRTFDITRIRQLKG